ncbi:protein HESO1 isoform X1 [Canna indica]|uniref:Protein HESO1 isoform X1 n=1 Tax=Canna indica TaxID=4628 RepID=A0AAQ3KUP3_9LILI|nr:protein HESO1 isoform X1 [Canna indica]
MDYYYHSSTHSDRLGILGGCLIDVLAEIKPSESDRLKRLNAINQLDNCLRNVQTLRGAAVKPFGSFVSNLYTKWGDLDVSVQLDTTLGTSASKKVKNNALRHIKKALHAYGLTHNVQFIPNARVPLLIFQSNYYNVSFDVSINNHLGIMKSKIILWISQMDERFRDMVLLTKEWAKAQGINDPKCGTLNSYSLCLLIIFHFQTCENPILPPLKEIFHGNISDYVTGWTFISEQNIEDVCAANIRRFRPHRRRNQSSLAQLLVSFFHKFRNIRDLATEYAICTYTGGWERISSHAKWANKPHSILIEDPFEQPENAARAVGLRQLFEISDAFTDAYNKLSSSALQ